jgi:hypothetical protein
MPSRIAIPAPLHRRKSDLALPAPAPRYGSGVSQDPTVDHLVVASRDLDAGTRWVADRLGVAPVLGGVHVGLGTRNALLGLGGPYLEVLSLDPEQTESSWALAKLVAAHETPALATVAIARTGLDDPIPMSRRRPDGSLMSWHVQFTSTPLFFIDWLDCPRPSGLPDGGRITSLSITTPEPAQLAGVRDIDVHEGPWRVDACINERQRLTGA